MVFLAATGLGAAEPGEAVYARVQGLLQGGDTRGASELLQGLVAADAKDVRALLTLARLHMDHQPETDSLRRAAAHIDAARQASPNDPRVWTEWGYLALAEWKLPDATGRFQRVIEQLDPRSFRAFHGLARTHVRAGRFYKAREVMRACLEAGPEDPENHWMAGNVELAATDEAGSVERAVGHYLFAAGLRDGEPRYKGWAIMAQFVARRYGAAKPLEEALKAQAPTNSYLMVAEGLRYELVADVAPARQAYQRAVEADWYNPWGHWCLANVLLGRGNLDLVEVAKLNPFFYGPFANPAAAEQHLLAVHALAPEFPFREKIQPALEAAGAARAAGEDPIFQGKLGRLRNYLGAIRSAPPDPKW
jgi:tetratricopeptide (TPR) repeat protein